MEEDLVGESVQRKRPIILYIIIGILVIIVIVLAILLGVKSGEKDEDKKQETFNPIIQKNFIPVKDSFYTNDTENGHIHIMEKEII